MSRKNVEIPKLQKLKISAIKLRNFYNIRNSFEKTWTFLDFKNWKKAEILRFISEIF